jgi:hypothetical protein
MEKILCKKDFNSSGIYGLAKFYVGEIYEFKRGNPWHGIYHSGGYVIGLSETNDFHEYFYSPDETINIKRTNLIDKMLP